MTIQDDEDRAAAEAVTTMRAEADAQPPGEGISVPELLELTDRIARAAFVAGRISYASEFDPDF